MFSPGVTSKRDDVMLSQGNKVNDTYNEPWGICFPYTALVMGLRGQ